MAGDVLHAHVVLVEEQHELVRLAQEGHRHLLGFGFGLGGS